MLGDQAFVFIFLLFYFRFGEQAIFFSVLVFTIFLEKCLSFYIGFGEQPFLILFGFPF